MRWSTETPAISRHPWPGSWGRGIPDRDPDTPSPFIPVSAKSRLPSGRLLPTFPGWTWGWTGRWTLGK